MRVRGYLCFLFLNFYVGILFISEMVFGDGGFWEVFIIGLMFLLEEIIGSFVFFCFM